MEHEIHDLSAAYALDALDGDDREAFEAHLETCDACRRDVASFLDVGAALAVAVAGPEPPASLRDRIVADARAERQTVVPFAPRPRRWAPALGAAAAAAAVAAIGIGLYAVSIADDLDATRTALERERAAAAVLATPDARTVALKAGEGRLVVAPDGGAVLVLAGLGEAPDGRTYQVWVVSGETPIPAGLFDGSDGADIVSVGEPVRAGEVVAVTVEPDGGVPLPTTDPVVASSPV